MQKKAFWKDGTSFPVSADVANDTINALKSSLGKDTITATELLDASRDENAPLHNCFEWDDGIAAEKFRRQQAAHLIRSIDVKIIYPDRAPVVVRAHVNITPPNELHKGGEYVSVQRAMEVTEYRERVLKRALCELLNFKEKYSAYEELAGVCSAIDDFADKLK